MWKNLGAPFTSSNCRRNALLGVKPKFMTKLTKKRPLRCECYCYLPTYLDPGGETEKKKWEKEEEKEE